MQSIHKKTTADSEKSKLEKKLNEIIIDLTQTIPEFTASNFFEPDEVEFQYIVFGSFADYTKGLLDNKSKNFNLLTTIFSFLEGLFIKNDIEINDLLLAGFFEVLFDKIKIEILVDFLPKTRIEKLKKIYKM